MSKHRKPDPGLGLGAWNTHNASEKRLRRYIKSRLRAGDVAICLTEVWSRHPALRKIANQLNLTMLAEDPIPGGRDRRPVTEHGDTVMLLAPEFVLDGWEVLELTEHWYVESASKWHAGRRLILARGRVGSQRVELLAVHGPTGNRWNAAAVAEFVDVVARTLTKTAPGTISAAFGDFNIRLPQARDWARRIGASVSGRGPDLVIAIGGHVASRRGRKRGSDHYAMSHKIKPTKRKRNP